MKTNLKIPSIQLSPSEILKILDASVEDQTTLSKLPKNLRDGFFETFEMFGNSVVEEIILSKILKANSIVYSNYGEAVGQFFNFTNSNEGISAVDALKELITVDSEVQS
jgi:hypothetical protein